jgi:cytoskeleton protein RodZ
MASFGAQLKREREQRKISLDDVSVSTKIGTRFLRAIEDNQFDQLPGGIFNKGFIRAYARYLGLDEDRTIADYLEASGAETSDPKTAESAPEVPVEPEEPTAARIPWGSFAIVLLLAALTFATLKFYSREKPLGNVRDTEISQPESSPLPAVQPVQTKAIVQAPEPQAQPAPSPPQKTPSTTGTFIVLLKARDDSWISGTVDGAQLPDQLLAASSEKTVSAQQSLTLRAGNIGALDIYFNGQKIPAQGEEGEVKTVAFDAHGLRVPTKP